MSNITLDDIVSIDVSFSPTAAVRAQFNLGLIVGNSTVISAATRVVVYNTLAEMATAGFDIGDAEYLAAQLYFAQTPTPSRLAIGRWDDATGDTPETLVAALGACRLANTEWYAFTVVEGLAFATDPVAYIPLIAAWAETAVPSCVYFYPVSLEADMLSIFTDLKGHSYKRSIGQYSTDSAYAVAAIMGYAMGANAEGLPAYDLAYKTNIGIAVEDLSSAELDSILAANGNVYINQGGTYDLFRQGVMANGSHFDEILGIDMIVNGLQTAVMNALTSSPKLPQTEGGMLLLISALTAPLELARSQEFIAPGIWTAAPVLNLETGATLSQGYLIQSGAISAQSSADRAARKAPPIYICIKLAGSIEYVTITLNVDR